MCRGCEFRPMVVVVLATGGTIAAVGDDDGVRPALSGTELLGDLPNLGVDVETREFATVPSPHFTVARLYDLVVELRRLGADDDVEGIVVTHGTDAIEESSYFVDLCDTGDTPVAFTGAMRPRSATGPDGPANLAAAVRTVASTRADEVGVTVVFNDRVYPARDVTKIHSSVPDAIRAPEFGPLAVVEEDRVAWRRSLPDRGNTFDPVPAALTADVHAIPMTIETPVEQVRSASNAEAVCVATMGAGRVPPTVTSALRTLSDDVPLIATTRCREGRLARGTYDTDGSEALLRELGAYASDRNLQKTRIKVIVALAADALGDAFERL